MTTETILEQKRAAAIARHNARVAQGTEQAATAAKARKLCIAGQFQVLLLECGLPLVRVGGAALEDLREDVYDAATNSNGRAGVRDISSVYMSAMMGGEPYAIWN